MKFLSLAMLACLFLASVQLQANEVPNCPAESVEAIKTELRVKKIRGEYDTIKDLIGPVQANIRTNHPSVLKTEICFDIGSLVHRIWYAIGTTGAHEPYVQNPRIAHLMNDLREDGVALSSWCLDDVESQPSDPMDVGTVRDILERIIAARDEMVQLLK